MRAKTIRWVGLLSVLAMSLINGLFILVDYDRYIGFLSRVLSPDGLIAQPAIAIIRVYCAFLVLAIFIVIVTTKSVVESFRLLAKSSKLNKAGYLVTAIVISSYTFCILFSPRLRDALYREDCFFENLTAVCAILSSIVMLICINKGDGRAVMAIKLILAILYFLFCMEETSWGQRIFGWNTPDSFAKLNSQHETNIHNLYTRLNPLLYCLFNFVLGVFLLNLEWIRKKIQSFLRIARYAYLLPPQEFRLYGLVFLALSAQSLYFILGGELTEEVFSVFGLAYALDQLVIAKTRLQ